MNFYLNDEYNSFKAKGVIFMLKNKRVMGLICLSMGIGMLTVIFLPWWGFIAAALLAVYGFWTLFF